MRPASQSQQRATDRNAEHDSSHPFAPGDIVSIFAFHPNSGRPFIEGRAEIIGPMRQAGYFRVRFFGDGAIRIRYVHPDLSIGNVERHLRLLVELWHTSKIPDHNDFCADPE